VQGASADSSDYSLVISLVANFVYGLAVFLADYYEKTSAKRNPLSRRIRLLITVAVGVLLDICCAFFLTHWSLVLPVLFTIVVLALVIYKELNQFWQIGIVGADRQVGTGVDYRTALGMCHHSFHFLGIGASKLTRDREAFGDAISRCSRDGSPVKLLLGRPNSDELVKFAQMANKDKASYQHAVTESLRFVAELRNNERKNISVRFYQTIPAFRLMFIDDSICLMSYYLMGKGDGSNLPQLHVIKTAGSRDIDSLYFAFTEYFAKMWNASDDWDFKEYL